MTTVEVFDAEVSEIEDSQSSGTNALPGSDFASARLRQRSASAAVNVARGLSIAAGSFADTDSPRF